MRGGWNTTLRSLLHAADPVLHLIAEVVRVRTSDIKDTFDEWNAADSTSGGQALQSGGIALFQSTAGAITQSSDNGTETDALTKTLPASALLIEWSGSNPESREIANLVARLDPQADGGNPKTAAEWRAQLFRVVEVGPDDDRIVVAPISGIVAVDATGTTADDVTFDFRVGGQYAPIVGPAPRYADHYDGSRASHPMTLVRIWAVTSTGAPADNVAWLADSTLGASISGSGYDVTHYTISEGETLRGDEKGAGTVVLLNSTVAEMPRFTINRSSYSAATFTFSGSGNRPQGLGLTGSHEIAVDGQTPGDSALTFEISATGAGTWVECKDGDIIGVDNSAQGGADLSGLTPASSYDMRVTLTPSTSGFLSPIARRMGVREVTTTDLAGVATMDGAAWQVEPRSLKGNITKATVRILKTGEKDYRDYGAQILAANHIGEIEVRVWVGDPTYQYLARGDWLHIDSFEIEDYTNESTAHVLTCISPLRRMRRTIPPFVATSGTDGERVAIEYSNETINAAAEDLVTGQVGLPGRFVGPLTEDTSLVTKTIRESDAKDELDRLHYLAGEAVITSQGRLKAVTMMHSGQGAVPPVATFLIGDYTPVRIGPGYSSRVDEFFVPHGWEEDEDGGRFTGESRYFNATATEKLGGRGLDTTERLDDETAKWIPDNTLGDAVARRVPNHFANGMMIWDIRSTYPHPYLEPGDPVVVVTDQYTGRSPITNQEVRGPVAASGTVVAVGDFWGRSLSIWVKAIDDVVLSDGDVTPKGFRTPQFRHARIVFMEDESVRFQGQLRPGLGLKAAISNSAFPSSATVLATTIQATDASGNFDIELATGWELEDTAYVAAHAFELADGSGAVSPLWRGKDANNAGELYNFQFLYDQPSVGKVTIKWTRGSAVDTVWVWESTFTLPMAATAEPYPDPATATSPTDALATGTDQYVVDIPAAGDVTFLQFDSRDSDLDPLHVYRYEIHPKAVSTGSELPPGSVIAEALVASAQSWGFDGDWGASATTTATWTSGTLTMADGTTYSINSGSATGLSGPTAPTFIYFDAEVSATDFQTTTNWGTAIGDTAVLIAVAWSGGVLANVVPGVGVLGLDGEAIHPSSIQTDRIAANAITAAKISVASLSAISADLGTVTAGTIEASVIVKSQTFSATLATYTGNLKVQGTTTLEGIVRFQNGAAIQVEDEGILEFYDSAGTFRGDLRARNTTAKIWARGDWEFFDPPGFDLPTEYLLLADAGSTGATEQDWIEVTVGGNTGYIRVFASK